MSIEKVIVTSCVHKKSGSKNGRNWTIWSIGLEDGRNGESFDQFNEGEQSIAIEDSKYGLKFSKPKDQPYQKAGNAAPTSSRIGDDVTLKSVALQNAVNLCKLVDKQVTTEQVLKVADLLYNWLKQKSE